MNAKTIKEVIEEDVEWQLRPLRYRLEALSNREHVAQIIEGLEQLSKELPAPYDPDFHRCSVRVDDEGLIGFVSIPVGASGITYDWITTHVDEASVHYKPKEVNMISGTIRRTYKAIRLQVEVRAKIPYPVMADRPL